MMDGRYLEALKASFQPVSFSKELENYFREHWVEKTYAKGTLITASGEVERYFYWVIEGVQALYLIDHRGEPAIFGFSFSGSFSGIFHSYLQQKPSDFFLEALTPSRVLALPLPAYLHLLEQYPDFQKWGRLFMQNILFGRIDREVELMTLAARDRFHRFMARCPDELRQIPQKYLASYLNMTPETFSRMRRREGRDS